MPSFVVYMDRSKKYVKIPISFLLNEENDEAEEDAESHETHASKSSGGTGKEDEDTKRASGSRWNDDSFDAKAASSGELQDPDFATFSKAPRRRWTQEEDNLVLDEVQRRGEKGWEAIARKLEGRKGEHVRLRYQNYLKFSDESIDKPFTEEEDQLILQEGSLERKWSILAARIGRSNNSVKNRFHRLQRMGRVQQETLAARVERQQNEEQQERTEADSNKR
eukprot:CAMPEP_0182446548 /NCGR_PEP_ID=MMETSP1172-20130603/4274_1 /TAXON_ID=708627 /ORGANISM="Timspurckia oligopyrenoides, Strain CCMP3278" /LENGTH=221 /DNA_ID=CAMNT_0024642499 /DNA_START=840 /DNA_END=1505 /DNA_ORIENTATION=+